MNSAIEKRGGRVLLNAHVDKITIDPSTGRATGVALRGAGAGAGAGARRGEAIRARRAVVTNASAWDSWRLVDAGAGAPEAVRRAVREMEAAAAATPACPSFMHLHVGFDATGLDGLEMHHIVVNDWERGVDAEQNVVLISIASVADPSLAPPGKHCLHAYVPATEPFAPWAGLDPKSPEYAALKEERSQVLWAAVERVIPDIRQRAEVAVAGTPLTHRRFLRRDRGSYGPAIRAGEALFPGARAGWFFVSVGDNAWCPLLCGGKDDRARSLFLDAVLLSPLLLEVKPIALHWQKHTRSRLSQHTITHAKTIAGPKTPIAGLYACGDSTFPGIGLPAVAASGAVCANTLVPLRQHLELLDSIGL